MKIIFFMSSLLSVSPYGCFQRQCRIAYLRNLIWLHLIKFLKICFKIYCNKIWPLDKEDYSWLRKSNAWWHSFTDRLVQINLEKRGLILRKYLDDIVLFRRAHIKTDPEANKLVLPSYSPFPYIYNLFFETF